MSNSEKGTSLHAEMMLAKAFYQSAHEITFSSTEI